MHTHTHTHTVAEAHPRFLRKSLSDVVTAMLSVARYEDLESATRSLAAEFLVGGGACASAGVCVRACVCVCVYRGW